MIALRKQRPRLRRHTALRYSRKRLRSGFTMFELVVASALVLMVLTGAGMVVSNTERISIATRAKDTATAFGIGILEKATAFGCGTQTTPGADSGAMDAKCKAIYVTPVPADAPTQTTTPAPGSDGAGGWGTDVIDKLMWDPTGRPFTVSYATRWLASSGDTTAGLPPCPDETGKPARPALLERTVTLRWLVLGKENEEALTTFTSVPSGMLASASLAGDLVVDAPEGSLVVLSSASGDPVNAVARVSAPCGSTGRSVAWFPFLKLNQPDTSGLPAITTFYLGLNSPGDDPVEILSDNTYVKRTFS